MRILTTFLKIFFSLLYVGLMAAAGYVVLDYLEMKSRDSVEPVTYVFVARDKKAYPLYKGESLRFENVTILAATKDGNISKVYVESDWKKR